MWMGPSRVYRNRVLRRVLAVAVTAALSMLFPVTVLAQAGSTGGTIGKTDKSVSGENTAGSPGFVVDNPKHRRRSMEEAKRRRSGESTRPEGKQKVFVNPTIDGLPVDRCLTYAADCNEPAATAWCRRKGISRATDWKYENKTRIGQVVGASTGDRRDCKFGCDGFTQVICK
jgi:hypothetical protein